MSGYKDKEKMEIKQEYYKTNRVVRRIHEQSKNGKNEFQDLYKLLTNEDLIYQALTRIRKNKGIGTKGADGTSIDGYGTEQIQELRKALKENRYEPGAVKRIEIPKPGKKKKRPLGIPGMNDKVVQEMINTILTAIYEPKFEADHKNANYGFRKRKRIKDAIEKIERKAKDTRWCLEGDIEGAYDNVNHGTMIRILEERIKDKRMIHLIKKILKSDIVIKGKRIETRKGTPQGGIISPTLFNIYMSKLDEYILKKIEMEEKREEEEGKTERHKKRNKRHNEITNRVGAIVRWIRTKENKEGQNRTNWNETDKEKERRGRKEIREYMKERKTIESRETAGTKHRTIYIRYADDWVVISNGGRKRIEEWKKDIKEELERTLDLKLSEEKTKITDLRKEPGKFLGFNFFYIRGKKYKRDRYGRIRKTTGIRISIGMDYERVLDKLEKKHVYDAKNGWGRAVNPWTVKSDYEIVESFNWLARGIVSYYAQGLNRFRPIERVMYIIDHACKKTIGKKHKMSALQAIDKYGDPIIAKRMKEGKEIRIRQFGKEDAKKLYEKIRSTGAGTERVYEMENYINWRTTLKLKSECVVCGSKDKIEMHHIKKVKDTKEKGFKRIMVILNRKQICVCKECHVKIHKGTYDGIKLEDLYNRELASL